MRRGSMRICTDSDGGWCEILVTCNTLKPGMNNVTSYAAHGITRIGRSFCQNVLPESLRLEIIREIFALYDCRDYIELLRTFKLLRQPTMSSVLLSRKWRDLRARKLIKLVLIKKRANLIISGTFKGLSFFKIFVSQDPLSLGFFCSLLGIQVNREVYLRRQKLSPRIIVVYNLQFR